MITKKVWIGIIILACIVVIGGGVWYLQGSQKIYSGPMEPVTIGTSPVPDSALFRIADSKGFFTHNGLNVIIQENQVSTTSLRNLAAGTIDIAGASDYAFMTYLFTEPTLQTFASTAKNDVISIVARKDLGILSPQDLAGKKIGCPKGTIAEFFLGRYLILNGINSSTVTVVNINPTEMPGAMANDTVDAVIIWEPYINNLQKQLGPDALVFPAQSGQYYYWLMICTNKTATERPEMVRRFLAALVEAESYTQQYPEEAQQIVANGLRLDKSYIREVWPKYHFIVSLDQSTIIAMEDEARWATKNNLTVKREVPNYLGNIYKNGLDAVKPQAVTVIR